MKTKRIIFITSMGIYNEIPESIGSQGNLKYNSILQDYRNAADIIEDSGMDYTIIRPGWFIQGPVNYELTQKGQAFGGHDVSISSISDLVKRITLDPELYSKENIGINQKEK